MNKYLFILLLNFVNIYSAVGQMPETLKREGHTFHLNGRSIHTVSILKVKVYEISLFLEKRSRDSEEILKSSERKLVILEFLRNVDSNALRNAFFDGFYENCADQCDDLKVHLDQLNSKMPSFEKGEKLEFEFLSTKAILRSSLGVYSEINDPDFGRVLLSMWLGSNPPSSDLKNQLLGMTLPPI